MRRKVSRDHVLCFVNRFLERGLPGVQFGADHRKVFKYLRDTTGDLCEILSWRIVPPRRGGLQRLFMVPSRYGKVVPGGYTLCAHSVLFGNLLKV